MSEAALKPTGEAPRPMTRFSAEEYYVATDVECSQNTPDLCRTEAAATASYVAPPEWRPKTFYENWILPMKQKGPISNYITLAFFLVGLIYLVIDDTPGDLREGLSRRLYALSATAQRRRFAHPMKRCVNRNVL